MKRRSRIRVCPFCGEKFTPGPHNRHHQRYCGKEECSKASHRASSKRWRRGKRNDPEHRKKEVERVRAWRESHPGCRKSRKPRKNLGKDPGLRDFAQPEKRGEVDGLRDVLLFQSHCLQGLVAQLAGGLRDDIGGLLNSYYDKGKELFPELEQQFSRGVDAHVEEGNRRAKPDSQAAGGLRVGRPSPDP
jgi:hypothetical protein